MTTTNHVITGVIIVLAIHNPAVALPLAFLSHFVLDALPHFGRTKELSNKKSPLFAVGLGADIICALAVFSMVALIAPAHWQLIILGGIVSASPDLLWLPGYITILRNHRYRPGPVRKLLGYIQWGERPWGILVEMAWFAVAVTVFVHLAVTRIT